MCALLLSLANQSCSMNIWAQDVIWAWAWLQASDPIPFVAGIIHLSLCFHVPCWNHKDIIIDLCRSLQFHLDHSVFFSNVHIPFSIPHFQPFFDSTSPFYLARQCCRQSSAIVEVEGIIVNECNSFAPAMILSRDHHILGSEVHGSPAFPGRPSDLLLPFWSVQDPISLQCVWVRDQDQWRFLFLCLRWC